MPYSPPLQLQGKAIWSLVVKDARQQKVPEHYYSKKKIPLHTWPEVQQRFKKHPSKYEPVVGLVSDEVFVIDIDKTPFLTQNIRDLIAKHPTYWHYSKSGNGWHIYYTLKDPLTKKSGVHASGEWYNGAFVTTTDPKLSDWSNYQITEIDPLQLGEFIPEVVKKMQPRDMITVEDQQPANEYLDGDKLFNEAASILQQIPVDLDPMLEIAYETKIRDFELNSYTHWLLVSHALSDLANSLARDYPAFPEKIAGLFLNWSQQGQTFQDDSDVLERFDRSYEETKSATNAIVTFKTLRKLFWAYKIPVSDFPVIKYVNKVKTVDASDPQNYAFLTDLLKLELCQDYIRGDSYIRGPKSLIQNYFKDSKFHYCTHNVDNISVPFLSRIKGDDNLLYRLVEVFRRFGIAGTTRAQPITAGLIRHGIEQIDTLYEWMQSIPWDKTPRALQIIEKSIVVDTSTKPSEVPDEFYHGLIFKHLIHMAGLRGKAMRTILNQNRPNDRFRKAQGILILAGYQNTRKSTWIECLLPPQVSSVSSVTPSSVKDTLEMQRALAGTFVLNIDEIDAVLDKMNLSDFKNVLTQEKDTYRTMYSQKFDDHPRAAGFFGTTNKTSMRLDRTGNRRFWIIPVVSCDAKELTTCDYQQFWAELLHYAETMSNDDWSLSTEEKRLINLTAAHYTAETTGSKSLDMLMSDDNGESKIYTHDEIDFEFLFNNCIQRVQRAFAKKNIFLPTRGNKAFKYIRALSIMEEDVELKLSSFSHVISEFTDSLTGWSNETKVFNKGVYKNGIFYYDTGKVKPTPYHFIPLRTVIDQLVEAEILLPGIYKDTTKKD